MICLFLSQLVRPAYDMERETLGWVTYTREISRGFAWHAANAVQTFLGSGCLFRSSVLGILGLRSGVAQLNLKSSKGMLYDTLDLPGAVMKIPWCHLS